MIPFPQKEQRMLSVCSDWRLNDTQSWRWFEHAAVGVFAIIGSNTVTHSRIDARYIYLDIENQHEYNSTKSM